MLHTTTGIVLHSFKYGDTSLIVRILTPRLGLQSYLVQGVRKTKSRMKANLFQPLTLLELVAYHKERSGLQRIKEARSPHPYVSIGTDIRKSSIALFLCEMLLNAFKHQEPQQEAYEFIYNAALRLELLEENLASFHIIFLLQLSKYLGFAPEINFSEERGFFNLQEGVYEAHPGLHGYFLNQEESRYFFNLSQTNLSGTLEITIPVSIRKTLLQKTIEYYRLHMEGFKEVKSLQVLNAVFENQR